MATSDAVYVIKIGTAKIKEKRKRICYVWMDLNASFTLTESERERNIANRSDPVTIYSIYTSDMSNYCEIDCENNLDFFPLFR